MNELAGSLRGQLSGLDGVTVHDQGVRRCGIVTFTVDGVPAAEIKQLLAAQDINTSVTGAASARFDLPRRGLDAMVRASVHYYNAEAEIARLISALPRPGRA